MKTDPIFYRLFQLFPSALLELIGRSPAEANVYEFTSVEVKQLAFRLDGLFLPAIESPEYPIYFVEVQFYKENDFYFRFFGEIFLYLAQYKPINPWYAVVIYPTRDIEVEETAQYGILLESERVKRVYLDELGELPENSIALGIVKLVMAPAQNTTQQARQLIDKTRQQLAGEDIQRDVLELLERIIVYKLPQLSTQELEQMFTLDDLKKTRVYQEAFQEGKAQAKQETQLENVRRMLQIGLSLEQIALGLDLPIEEVRKIAEQSQS